MIANTETKSLGISAGSTDPLLSLSHPCATHLSTPLAAAVGTWNIVRASFICAELRGSGAVGAVHLSRVTFPNPLGHSRAALSVVELLSLRRLPGQ